MIALVGSLGYFAVFAGALLEGEVTLVAAGIAAQQGFVSLPLVIGAATVGAALGDQCWFFLGRRKWSALLACFAALAANDARVFKLLKRYPAAAILVARFLCGLRSATAAMLGATDIRASKFCALNALGAGAWAGIVAGAGYAFGAVVPNVVTDVRRLEAILLAGLVLAGGWYCVRRPWRRRS